LDPNPDPTPAKMNKDMERSTEAPSIKNIRSYIQFTDHFRGAPNRGHLKFVFTKGSSGRSYYLLQLMAKKKTLRTLKIKAFLLVFFGGSSCDSSTCGSIPIDWLGDTGVPGTKSQGKG